VILIRRELGDVLRERRQSQGRTLREVSSTASVSLGYLSEIERGEKEASSELLAAICAALELPVSRMLRDVSERVAHAESAPAGVAPAVALPMGSAADRAVQVSAA
jgi:transcriptional regulator with XRE-family HTH domain